MISATIPITWVHPPPLPAKELHSPSQRSNGKRRRRKRKTIAAMTLPSAAVLPTAPPPSKGAFRSPRLDSRMMMEISSPILRMCESNVRNSTTVFSPLLRDILGWDLQRKNPGCPRRVKLRLMDTYTYMVIDIDSCSGVRLRLRTGHHSPIHKAPTPTHRPRLFCSVRYVPLTRNSTEKHRAARYWFIQIMFLWNESLQRGAASCIVFKRWCSLRLLFNWDSLLQKQE